MKLRELAGVVHIYPTFAEINKRVADEALKESLTPAARKWLRRLFRLRGSASTIA